VAPLKEQKELIKVSGIPDLEKYRQEVRKEGLGSLKIE